MRYQVNLSNHIYRLIILVVLASLYACVNLNQEPITQIEEPATPSSESVSLIPIIVYDPSVTAQSVPPKINPESYPPPQIASQKNISPTPTIDQPALTPTTIPPDYWMSLPIIPEVSQTARQIYQHGIEIGRDPHAFSKIGDCQSISTYFLSYFDLPDFYDLGEYTSLQATIDWYAGSFSRDSLAVKGGFNAAAILSPLRADPTQCNPDENPIACEFHLHNPSVAMISLEEWWAGHPENYEKYMRQIIEYSIRQGVLPIVATKADNLEGNHLINQTIARLALEYDIPLWNFWLAVQPLDNHGLIAVDVYGAADMFHLTHSDYYYFYNDPNAKQSGWSVRNLTALQALDAVRRGLAAIP